MSEATISALQLQFILETFELVEEEFQGMEDYTGDYVLTTGAQEQVEEAKEMIEAFLDHLEANQLEEEDDAEIE
jgi:hypothetical protein